MDPKIFVLIGFLGLSAAFIGLAVVLPIGIAFVIPKLILLIIGILFDVLAFASRYYGYLLLPLARQHKKNIIISDQSAYWLSSTGDCIVRKLRDDYIATAYINIPLYVSASEMTDDEKVRFTNQVSRLVGISKEPVRFTSELYLMNKDQYIQQLKDVISQTEEDEAKLLDKKADIKLLEHTRGKLSMWRKMLENVGSENSFELASFATISAKGTKEFEAITIVRQKAIDLMNGIASTLGVPPNLVLGEEILKYLEPEYLIPYSTVTEQISQDIRQEVS